MYAAELSTLSFSLAVVAFPLATFGVTFTGSEFYKSSWCPLITSHSILATAAAGSLMDCAVQCRQNPRCDVVEFCPDASIPCVMSSKDVTAPNASAVAGSCLCMERRCLHGGVEQEDGSCGCVDGYVGDRCQHLTADCKELWQLNSSARNNVFLFLTPAAPRPFPLLCGASGAVLVVGRSLDNENFNRSWEDYAGGFGSFDSWSNRDWWTGLRSWHYLTSNRLFALSVYIYMENGTFLEANFYNLRVGEEDTGFPLFYGSSGGPLGNSLSKNKFSTFDKDHDASADTHCAQLHGGGWWFSDCGDSNPTGPLLRPPGGLRLGIPAEAFWTNNLGNVSVWQVFMVLK